MKALLLLVGLVIIVQADEASWNSFQKKYGKVYTNQIKQQLRKKVFNDNLQKIEEHNKKYELGLVSYKVGVNKFADLTAEEFAARFKTLEADESSLQGGEIKQAMRITNKNTKELPESIDWRTKSAVTDVKDQGSCGGCWAFSAVGTIEGQVAIHTGELKSLSPQQLIDCDTSVNAGCSGGIVQYAISYVARNGITLEQNYPYKAVQQSCSTSKSKPAAAWSKGYVNILQNNETDLKQAVGLVGPVSVAINSIPIKSYTNGIFDDTCSDKVNHGVLVVGYGTDNETGIEYWIIKNSWGTDWGDQGYFKMRMGKNLCGITKQSCYAVYADLGSNSGYSIKAGLFSIVLLTVYFCISISFVNLYG